MMKTFAAMAVLVALSACATPITKAEITPVYAGQAPENLNIAVVDHRSFILSGNKEEWFEGIMRGGFGIPMSLQRPGPKSGQPFALYLSSMLADAMVAAGSNVTIVPIAKGTKIDEAIGQSSIESNTQSIIFLMYKSRYDVGFSAEYNHHFDVFVVNQNGEMLINKTFSRFDTDIPSSTKYNIFDMYSEIYKKVLDEILHDPDIATALAEAAIR
jgi:hypothetical protein